MWVPVGPVALYSTTVDLAVEDVQWAWLYAVVMYQEDFDGPSEEYYNLFSPESFNEWVREQQGLGSVAEAFCRLVR